MSTTDRHTLQAQLALRHIRLHSTPSIRLHSTPSDVRHHSIHRPHCPIISSSRPIGPPEHRRPFNPIISSSRLTGPDRSINAPSSMEHTPLVIHSQRQSVSICQCQRRAPTQSHTRDHPLAIASAHSTPSTHLPPAEFMAGAEEASGRARITHSEAPQGVDRIPPHHPHWRAH
jgi:hypothetical protein